MTAAMGSLADGDIDTQVPAASRGDEIGLMARAVQHFKDAAVAKLASAPGGALIVPPDTFTVVHRGLIVAAVRRHRIPAIYSYRQIVKDYFSSLAPRR